MEQKRESIAAQEVEHSTPEDDKGAEERTFTQEEVNRIVSDRLAKERARQTAPTERELALDARESRLTCREYLVNTGGPSVLLEALDTADPAAFREKVEMLRAAGILAETHRNSALHSGAERPRRTGMNFQNSCEVGGGLEDRIAETFQKRR